MEISTTNTVEHSGNDSVDLYTNPPVKDKWGLDLDTFSQIFYVNDVQEFVPKMQEDPTFLPTIIVYAIAFFVGVMGNTIVVLVLLVDKKARNVTNSFLVSLAVADLLFLLLIVPYDVAVKLLDLAVGRAFCKLSHFVEMLTVSASIWNLTSVSVER